MTTPALAHELRMISRQCTDCGLCIKECAFLQTHGTPKTIAEAYTPSGERFRTLPFECSLCELCAAVCPVAIDPSVMFLEMRREAVRQGTGDFPEHAGFLKYETRGTSRRYTWYGLPKDCDTVFFPGCSLPGTRPDQTFRLYDYLKKQIPSLGVVLDCCAKPSHDLGRETRFNAVFGEMKDFLVSNGIRQVYVACPNCYKVFSRYGEALSVATVYEFLAKNGLPSKKQVRRAVSIHDPCAVRFEPQIHSAVRELAAKQGLTVEEMPHSRETTFCCGEGGGVRFMLPLFMQHWCICRKKEAPAGRMLTYCTGCAQLLDHMVPTSHILDVLFEPDEALAGKVRVSRSPFTYLNRIRLKRQLKKTVGALVERERPPVGADR